MVFKYLICSSVVRRCDVCNDVDLAKFSESMVANRRYNNWRTLCLDCTNPACTVPDCTTCTICWNRACKRKDRWEKRAASLKSSQDPKSMADKVSFRCSACRKIKFRHCKRAATRSQQQRHRKMNATAAWASGDCRTGAVLREDARKLYKPSLHSSGLHDVYDMLKSSLQT